MALKNLVLFLIVASVTGHPYTKGENRIKPAFGRVIGGQETDISRRPYMASLQLHVGPLIFHNCGASIISSKFLLSAAHCDPRANLRNCYARMGSTSYLTGGLLLKVDKFIRHPDYLYDILDNDFGIASFEEGVEITFGPNIQVLPLTNTENPVDNSFLTLAGWGITADGAEEGPEKLREVQLPLVNQDRCRTVYSFLTPRQMCMGGTPTGDVNPCNGDSGSPAVQNGIQYGITSGVHITGCSAPNMPSVFARVSTARDWIRGITGV